MLDRDRFGCCNKPHSTSPFWDGPGFSRRQFFRITGTGVSGYFFTKLSRPIEVLAAGNVTPKATARNTILIFLRGAASHVDTFDLKEGPWLPGDFAPTSYGGIRFPQGLMPNLADQLDKLTIVRSVQAWALVHGLAQIWTQIARNPTAALGKIAPHHGAVVALEKEEPDAKLPGFISLNARAVGSGYLPGKYAPFAIAPNPQGLLASTHPQGQERFNTRFELLNSLDGSLRADSPLGREAENMATFYEQARGLMYSPEIEETFQYTAEESDRYGGSAFGNACLIARNIVRTDLGTRYIQIDLGGWDNHSNIYQPNAGIYPRARQLDRGLAPLLEDLDSSPGVNSGKTMLDETLIVVLGEFGRTVGNISNRQGRDHYLQQFVVFAGGGTHRGRIVGATDPTGAYTAEPGWEQNRPVRPEDIAATIYSAMGIDWTTVRYDDPFKRGFSYVPFAAEGTYGPVNAVFA